MASDRGLPYSLPIVRRYRSELSIVHAIPSEVPETIGKGSLRGSRKICGHKNVFETSMLLLFSYMGDARHKFPSRLRLQTSQSARTLT